MISLTCNTKSIVQMNLSTKHKLSHRCRKQDYQGGSEEGGINWETETDIYTLLQITNKNLPHSTENSIQYFTIAYMGKESKKEWICV